MPATGWPLLFASFGLGIAHAFDADHLAAVTALASERPHWRRAMVCAIHWALGHGTAVVTLGLLLLATPWGGVLQGSGADIVVGGALLALGLWTAWNGYRRGQPHDPWPRALAGVFGLLHGTAGVATVLGLLGVARASTLIGLSSLAAFSAGVFAAMFVLALGLGSLYQRVGVNERWRSVVQIGIGLATMLIGASMLIP